MKTATPAKLRSGAWGARVAGRVEVGEPIEIQTRSGKTWTATVSAVVWEGTDVTLVATSSSSSRRRGSSRSSSYPSRYSDPCGCRCGCDGESGGCRICDRDCAQM